MSDFRPLNRAVDFLMPPSVDEWQLQRHLARLVVEAIERLDLRAMTAATVARAKQPSTPGGARAVIEAQAKERHARERAEHEARLAGREGRRRRRARGRAVRCRLRRWPPRKCSTKPCILRLTGT